MLVNLEFGRARSVNHPIHCAGRSKLKFTVTTVYDSPTFSVFSWCFHETSNILAHESLHSSNSSCRKGTNHVTNKVDYSTRKVFHTSATQLVVSNSTPLICFLKVHLKKDKEFFVEVFSHKYDILYCSRYSLRAGIIRRKKNLTVCLLHF